MGGRKLRIGTRGSRLALAQTDLAAKALHAAWPELETEIVILRTKGDQVQDRPLSQVGQKGVFVSEFETALLEGRIDLAVHSGKDLPVRLAEGLDILAVLPRADVRDVLVLPRRSGTPGIGWERAFASFPEGAVIGTGSLRRRLYGKRLAPQASFQLIRGNVDTRLKKLEDGGYDGIILAKAGLDRLGIPEREGKRFIFLPIPVDRFLPAACQGIIAVEGRPDRNGRLAGAIDDRLTRLAFETERRALRDFGADCSAPAAAYCRAFMPGQLRLSVMYGGRELSRTAPEEERFALADSLCAQVKKTEYQDEADR
ncbi:MAG TPA: hydroxymethylbilane synthase [Candidatus Eisenbergiella merdipullorum]|uniref:Hydroxymethylbilane synthase n=1 Tax=Candidatus Eisenbergiella merdipullorum TaxID=2838553 RepID=A0A9D2I7J6_9FIRM|nr:hydroxymethylbilane synthase [Candidatus Eisenbergiella merdipullorum]